MRGLIHREPDDLFTINMFYWPPGAASPPHEHRNWTVTGVVSNVIEVRTFTAEGGKLVESRAFAGLPGQVGAVRPPCIHSVRNPSQGNAATLHVFGRPTALPDTTWYTGEDIDEGSRGAPGALLRNARCCCASSPRWRWRNASAGPWPSPSSSGWSPALGAHGPPRRPRRPRTPRRAR